MYCSKCGKEIEVCKENPKWGYCKQCGVYTKLEVEKDCVEAPRFASAVLAGLQICILMVLIVFGSRWGVLELHMEDKEGVLGILISLSIGFLLTIAVLVIECSRQVGWEHRMVWIAGVLALNFPFFIFIVDLVRAYLG